MRKSIKNFMNVCLPLVSVSMMLMSCGGSSGDNTGENWIIAILLLLAMLKKG